MYQACEIERVNPSLYPVRLYLTSVKLISCSTSGLQIVRFSVTPSFPALNLIKWQSYIYLIFLLGFQPGGDPAFCGILGTETVNSTETQRIVYPIIIGYEVWNYLAFLVLPVLYVSVRCKIRMAAKLEGKVSSSECSSLTCNVLMLRLVVEFQFN